MKWTDSLKDNLSKQIEIEFVIENGLIMKTLHLIGCIVQFYQQFKLKKQKPFLHTDSQRPEEDSILPKFFYEAA